MGFFSALLGGQDKNLNTLIGQFGQTGGQQVGAGQKNQNAAGDFWNSILSGDASKQAQALAPAISAEKTANQQTQKSNTEMGTRSGGTAATNAASSDKTHSDITNLIGSLTNSSASNLANLGTSQVGQGLGALGQEQEADHQRYENWMSSILGKGITGAAGAAESFGLGAAGGSLTGVGAAQGGYNALFGRG